MKRVEFTIPGEPKGKGRPRFARTGKYVRTYTPQDTVNYENLVKLEYQNSCGDVFFDKDTAVYMQVFAYYSIPKSASKKKQQEMIEHRLRPLKKPDSDNILKAICDGLNGVAYVDDTQIVDTVIRRFYGEIPHVDVALWEI